MSSEITITLNFNVRNGSLQFRGLPSGFSDDMAGQAGPTPGSVQVTSAGQDVSLSQLSSLGGWCFMANYGASIGDTDKANRVSFGIWDVSGSKYWPLGCVYPGKAVLFCLDPELGYDEPGTGTGTGSATSRLRLRANRDPCHVGVYAFDP